MEGVTRAPHAVRVQLAECVRSLVYSDYPQHWPDLLPQVQQYLTSQASEAAAGRLGLGRLLRRLPGLPGGWGRAAGFRRVRAWAGWLD